MFLTKILLIIFTFATSVSNVSSYQYFGKKSKKESISEEAEVIKKTFDFKDSEDIVFFKEKLKKFNNFVIETKDEQTLEKIRNFFLKETKNISDRIRKNKKRDLSFSSLSSSSSFNKLYEKSNVIFELEKVLTDISFEFSKIFFFLSRDKNLKLEEKIAKGFKAKFIDIENEFINVNVGDFFKKKYNETKKIFDDFIENNQYDLDLTDVEEIQKLSLLTSRITNTFDKDKIIEIIKELKIKHSNKSIILKKIYEKVLMISFKKFLETLKLKETSIIVRDEDEKEINFLLLMRDSKEMGSLSYLLEEENKILDSFEYYVTKKNILKEIFPNSFLLKIEEIINKNLYEIFQKMKFLIFTFTSVETNKLSNDIAKNEKRINEIKFLDSEKKEEYNKVKEQIEKHKKFFLENFSVNNKVNTDDVLLLFANFFATLFKIYFFYKKFKNYDLFFWRKGKISYYILSLLNFCSEFEIKKIISSSFNFPLFNFLKIKNVDENSVVKFSFEYEKLFGYFINFCNLFKGKKIILASSHSLSLFSFSGYFFLFIFLFSISNYYLIEGTTVNNLLGVGGAENAAIKECSHKFLSVVIRNYFISFVDYFFTKKLFNIFFNFISDKCILKMGIFFFPNNRHKKIIVFQHRNRYGKSQFINNFGKIKEKKSENKIDYCMFYLSLLLRVMSSFFIHKYKKTKFEFDFSENIISFCFSLFLFQFKNYARLCINNDLSYQYKELSFESSVTNEAINLLVILNFGLVTSINKKTDDVVAIEKEFKFCFIVFLMIFKFLREKNKNTIFDLFIVLLNEFASFVY